MAEARRLLKALLSRQRTSAAPTRSVVVETLEAGGTVEAVVVAGQAEVVAVVAVADQTEATTTTQNTLNSPISHTTAPTRDENH